MLKEYKVSICMITYNHEKYIRQAIEGVLMQQCDFDFELIICNDHSLDDTNSVIQQIINKPENLGKIKYFNHQENIGMMSNFIFALQKCEGNYIALCEGDDYWIDSLKLQKQVDFLDTNDDYIIHSGVANILRNGVFTKEKIGSGDDDKIFEAKDFFDSNNLVTCTVMYRNQVDIIFEDFKDAVFGDWFLYSYLLVKSNMKAYRSMETMAVYNIHNSGAILSMSNLNYNHGHINQIIKIKKSFNISKLNQKTIFNLNKFSLKKFEILIQNRKYYEAVKTVLLNFFYVGNNFPYKAYLRFVKNKFIIKQE